MPVKPMLNPESLKSFLNGKGVEYKLVEVPKASTSLEAAESLGVKLDRIAKTLVLISERGEAVLAVIRGDRKADLAKLARLLGYEKLRLANEREVVEITGYPPGGVPPIGHRQKLRVYVDKELQGHYYTGGGDAQHLLFIKAEDIVKLSEGIVLEIPKIR